MPAITDSFKLPCGVTLSNRLCKAAMTEGLADAHLRATPRLDNLYRQWSEGGAGLLITGNVQIDRRVLERPGNVAIDITAGGDSPESRTALQRWARSGTVAGNQLWMQISQAGRQSPRYVSPQPMGPSEVQLDLFGSFGRPRAITEAEILDLIQRFGRAAAIARECGFTGVQIHSAHGYLLSSFLSPVTNLRTDAWGGGIESRARMLIEVVRATRRNVGADFPVSVKLNSDDFRKGGFSHEDCLQVVQMLNSENLDLLEISGGNYEQPKLLGFTGREQDAVPQRESTKKREAYFLDYAASIRKIAKMPLMVTGGFRSRAGMDDALTSGDCDVIGLGRPLCTHTDAPKKLLSGEQQKVPAYEHELVVKKSGLFSPASEVLFFKMLNVQGAQGWYYHQLFRLADGKGPDLGRSVLFSFLGHWWDELTKALRMHLARS